MLALAALATIASCAKTPEPPPRVEVRPVRVGGRLPNVLQRRGEVVVHAVFRAPCAPYPLTGAAEREGDRLVVRISGSPAMVPCPIQRETDETYEVSVRPPRGPYRLTLVHHYEDGFWPDTTILDGRAVMVQ